LVAIGEDLITADQIYRETLSVLDREAGTATTGRSPPDWRHSA
jgi:hypothetical protein